MTTNDFEDSVQENFVWARLVFFLSLVVILTALGFEYLGGYAPCPLCLQQRYAYYSALCLLALVMILNRRLPTISLFLFFLVGLGYSANTFLGAYHAGVEWHFWAGPDTCATQQALPQRAEDLLADLGTARVVRCDEAALRFLGLSFAGWNTLVSLLLSALSFLAIWNASKRNR
ncbi:MAG: disulfide bond formation protein B [Hyphomicrobium sp.]